jgi:GWxTD domain-containing protein
VKNFLLIIALICIAGSLLSAQGFIPKTPLVVNVDISRFRVTPDVGYLEVYYAGYPSTVTLERFHDTLRGAIRLHTRIINKKNDSLIVRSGALLPLIATDTALAALRIGYISKTIYQLPVGSYEIYIKAFDDRNQVRQDSIRENITMNKASGAPTLSDVDLCSRIVPSTDKTNPFYKNSYEVTPNPSLLFGAQFAPVVFYYTEVYDLNPDTTYSIVAGVMDNKGAFIKQRKRNHKFSASNIVDVNSLNVRSLPSGKYRFVVILSDTLGKEISRTEKPIFINNPQVPSIATTAFSAQSADFAWMSDDELIDEFRKAKYIADDESIKFFDKKITTMAGRREFLAKFWSNIESREHGLTDLTRTIYLDRVRIANQRYHAMGKEGWQSDRGRVYLLYAEPDDVERFPSESNSKPYEIWHYNQIESGVIFVFIDRTGFGEYSLVHSTKRGEIQDDSWQQYLQ